MLVWSIPALGMLYAKQIWAFFDPQFFLKRLACDFHFLGVGRHEWNKQVHCISFEQACPNILSANQIWVFFDLKYLWSSFVFDFIF